MARIEQSGGYQSDGTGLGARSRRARLTAEFEADLGVDFAARARKAAAERRWIRIKTFIVWSIALIFFTIACTQLFVLRKEAQEPFSGLSGWFDWVELPPPPPPTPVPNWNN
jgi:hypothetical protein